MVLSGITVRILKSPGRPSFSLGRSPNANAPWPSQLFLCVTLPQTPVTYLEAACCPFLLYVSPLSGEAGPGPPGQFHMANLWPKVTEV